MVSAVQRRPRLSPLRYPGGKSSLYPFFRQVIRSRDTHLETYVEPYAGGAGAALALLFTGEVERIVINDLDRAIFAFWYSVTHMPNQFTDMVQFAELSISEWERQKSVYQDRDESDLLSLGFATFYLNRTNRSGVLNAGPIGGKSQSGSYKIDARFNKPALLERLRLIRLYASRITVRNEDGRSVISEFAKEDNVFIYADPPYFEKAGSLYMNSFKESDHRQLAACLNSLNEVDWVLTYDNVPQVAQLYSGRRRDLVPIYYSANKSARVNEVMVFSDSLSFMANSG